MSLEDAVSKCSVVSGPGSHNSPPAIRELRTEISRLPGFFRVGLNTVERLDCSTPDGHITQPSQRFR